MYLIWEKWKIIALKLGDLQFNILFSLLYYLLIAPVGIVSSLFSDYLSIKNPPQWEDVRTITSDIDDLKKQ